MKKKNKFVTKDRFFTTNLIILVNDRRTTVVTFELSKALYTLEKKSSMV